jgi:two-component system, OmpR family, response regulator
MSKTILIADDEPNIVLSLEYLLERDGYRVVVARDGDEALEALERERPDLVLLDVMLPRRSGYEVCQRIREDPRWAQLRVVMLTAKGREGEISKGIALGADAYVTKPFSTRELVTRVKVILRRLLRSRADDGEAGEAAQLGVGELGVGELRLNPETHRCWWRADEVVLTATEFRLLEALMGRPGRVYSREELSELAYPDDRHVSGRTLDSHIRRIRGKFRDHGIDPVETVHGVGYRLREP